MFNIGVLALQGDVDAHIDILELLGARVCKITKLSDLHGLDGIVIPGGESTTFSMLLESSGLFEPIKKIVSDGIPTLGTCAGLILLSTKVLDGRSDQKSFGLLNAVVKRNGFGRQISSFVDKIELQDSNNGEEATYINEEYQTVKVTGAFIRAPKIVSVGPGVQVLGTILQKEIVYVREKNIFATSFHPEITRNTFIHEKFLDAAKKG